ncbi:hypothetical protein BKH43_04230 [Helicobacter sp. 13S00401-1]|uniref:group III truncated hemoglobin n=1 Tax=Helicobacter sp. 13S00401-1 TaxID=1905758 RepID=UPI000BA4E8E9|nr:group III truncated hemoglobin [Helicobacter sp. 13S00401-1]PAF50771.1 hypothetical protein BKH43_04230 [Helicobacter sp. 13S00401-1]
MKQTEITPENIKTLMDNFYARIRKDEHLGAIFNEVVGTDEASWEAHKIKIANFWRHMLLGEDTYNGLPLKVHLELKPFPRERFAEWLGLFEKSLDEIYEEAPKKKILDRANMIASRFQKMMYEFPH